VNSVMPSTLARSASTTMTAARVRNVMLEVAADFTTVAVAGLADYDRCVGWRTDLTFLLEKEAVKSFQIQFKCAGCLSLALEYTVRSDGTLQSNDKAGGIDYFALPQGTKASLLVTLSDQAGRSEAVLGYLRQRNWGFGGQAVTGSDTQDRIYSVDGYGVVRNKIGAW
jgi:hypothetical protein